MGKQCWIKMSQQCDSSLQTLSQVLTVVAQWVGKYTSAAD